MGKLFIANISWKTTENELTYLLLTYGDVQSVKIITDRETGRSKGFGFVEMEHADDAVEALNGTEFMGRELVVKIAEDRPKK